MDDLARDLSIPWTEAQKRGNTVRNAVVMGRGEKFLFDSAEHTDGGRGPMYFSQDVLLVSPLLRGFVDRHGVMDSYDLLEAVDFAASEVSGLFAISIPAVRKMARQLVDDAKAKFPENPRWQRIGEHEPRRPNGGRL